MGISVKAVSVIETKTGVKMRKELAFAYASLNSEHFINRVKKMIRDQEQEADEKNPLTDSQMKKAVSGLKKQAREDAILINAVSTLTLKADSSKIEDYKKKEDDQMAAMAGIVRWLEQKARERADKAAETRWKKKRSLGKHN